MSWPIALVTIAAIVVLGPIVVPMLFGLLVFVASLLFVVAIAVFEHTSDFLSRSRRKLRPAGGLIPHLNPEEGATSGDERIARTGVGATGPGPSSGGGV